MAAGGAPLAAPGTSTLPFKIFTLGFLTKCIIVCFLAAPSSAAAAGAAAEGSGGQLAAGAARLTCAARPLPPARRQAQLIFKLQRQLVLIRQGGCL